MSSCSMGDSDTTDDALQRVRAAFDTAADEAEEMSEKAREEVTDAIDNLEDRINDLREREIGRAHV